jgi:site-specific DNA recombinase
VASSDDLSSCEVQHEACRAFVRSHAPLRWKLIEERFDDDGFSGATLDRPALQRLLAFVRNGEVDTIVVYRLDRLARSLLACANLLQQLREHGVGLAIVTAPELGFAAQDSFMLNILASFAEFEREMIAARIAESRARLKTRGRRIAGAVPFGYEADRRTKQLVLNEEEAAIMRWMFERAAASDTPASIAKAANARGFRTKLIVNARSGVQHGGNSWTARQVLATLRNPIYVGQFRDKHGIRVGHHQPIVTKEMFATVAARLQSRRTRTPGKRYKIDWPLKGRIVCGICNRLMGPHTILYRNIVYRYYRCRSTAGGRAPCSHQVSAQTIEDAVVRNISEQMGIRSKESEVWDLIEIVIYDHRVAGIRVRVVLPVESEPDADSAESLRLSPASESRSTGPPSRQVLPGRRGRLDRR